MQKQTADLSTLRDMFPDTSEDELEDVLATSSGLGEAVEFLIGSSDEACAQKGNCSQQVLMSDT